MVKSYKSALLTTAAVSLGLTLLPAVPAAHAQSGSGQPLEEIIVTARRVEERLQTVPISMTVYNQQQLTNKNIVSAVDLALATPSLSINTQFGVENPAFSLRGFSQDIGTQSTVGVFFADVVAPRGGVSGSQEHAGDGGGPGSFFDLQNVQVLKGPQGTLFGRNTTGGDILLVPVKPTPNFEGFVEMAGGNYSMEHLTAVVNLPVNDKVRLRLGVDQETRDGYMKNISGVGPSDFANINYVAGRVSLLIDPTDDIENYTIGSFTQSDSNGPLSKLIECNTNSGGLTGLTGPAACIQLARDQGRYVAENGMPNPQSYLRQWQIINTTTWQVNDDLTVKNIASYYQLQNRIANTLFGDNFTFPAKLPASFGGFPTGPYGGQHYYFVTTDSPPGEFSSDQQGFTEELQVHGLALNEKLSWQAGGYWEGSYPLGIAGADSPTLLECTNYYTQQCVDPVYSSLQRLFNVGPAVGNTHTSTGTITYRDVAAYFQGTYSILDNLKFTGGVRWTNDSTSGNFNLLKTLYIGPNPSKPPFPPGLFTGPAIPQTGCALKPPLSTGFPDCLLSLHTSSRQPTWVMDLDWTPVEDLLTYVKYSRGYREGGLAGTGPVDPAIGSQYLTFQPEQVDTYEIGAKKSFRGEIPGTLNVAAFYNDFSQQQVLAGFNVKPQGGATPTASITNIGSSRIYGFELSSTIVPLPDLTLSVDYTYLNTKVESVQPIVLPADSLYIYTPQAAPGSLLPFSPHNKFSLTATYRLPVDEALGKISLIVNDTYTGTQAVNPLNAYGYLKSYNLINLNVNWESIMGSQADAEFFMTNALDRYYRTNIQDFSQILGTSSALYGEPRMFGGRLRYHFGGPSEAPAEAAPYTPPPPQPPAVARSYMVFFDFDKSDLTADAVKIVDQAAANAAPAKATTITLTGHTDTVGSDAYNMRLGKRRAESVAAQLEKDGIPSGEIVLVSKGKRDLLVPTKDGVREPQNRRVTIVYDGGPMS
jgi:iron complex outermembrane receptor protein